ncbi:MAG: TSUP family transporter [Candidatus Peregrinibacteria bacterium]
MFHSGPFLFFLAFFWSILFIAIGGGGLPLFIAFFQVFFPSFSLGNMMGLSKMGGVVRGIGVFMSVYKEIEWKRMTIISIPFLLGSIVGASFIADISDRFIPIILCGAFLFSELATLVHQYLTQRRFLFLSFLVGGYGGVLGAAIPSMIVTLLRFHTPEDEKIVHLQIQARVILFAVAVTSFLVHIWHGNILWEYAFWWAGGSFLGGIVGGKTSPKNEILFGKMAKRIFKIFVSHGDSYIPLESFGVVQNKSFSTRTRGLTLRSF